MTIHTKATHRVRQAAWRAILNGIYALAIVSDGRRYMIGAKNTGSGVVILSKKYEKVAHAEAVAHTKFPGRAIVRVAMPKVTKTKAKQAA
jgi:hypothetical protein